MSRDVGYAVVSRPGGDTRRNARRLGFTLVELLVVIAIIGILIGLLLPGIQAARESARRASCSSNLRQLAVAAHAYHNAYGYFPKARVDTTNSWSQFVRLLPYLEQGPLYKTFDINQAPSTTNGAYLPTVAIGLFRCPSDGDHLDDASQGENYVPFQHNNYKGNAGNQTGVTTVGTDALQGGSVSHENNNGVFVTNKQVSISSITDGTSNTALFSEGVLGDGDDSKLSIPGDWIVVSSLGAAGTPPAAFYQLAAYTVTATGQADTTKPGALNPHNTSFSAATYTGAGKQFSYGGRNFSAGNYVATRYNHIVTPNLASIATDITEGDPLPLSAGLSLPGNPAINETANATTASSRHVGGVNLALADGSVTFISDSIGPAIWWALGSVNGDEASVFYGTAKPQ